MTDTVFSGVELLPESVNPRQLFILLHGFGTNAADMVPLAERFRSAYPDAAFLIPEGTYALGEAGTRRQWFDIEGVAEENRPQRIADAMPALLALVRQAQDRLKILSSDTALVGFSQGGIMALEFSTRHDGNAGRILVFSGRYGKLPEVAPELTTIHLFHGELDRVIPVDHAYAAYAALTDLQGDVTLDLAADCGHEITDALIDKAVSRLQTCVPLRSWKRALDSA
ncbi:MAG: esterase [Burkholderiales bacterium]